MIEKKDYGGVRQAQQECRGRRFEDVRVQIGDDIHYKGTNVVVTSRLFEGLLAEQRFHHVVRAVPKNLYEAYLRRGVVWFELAPGETGVDLMKMPRSKDVKEEAIAVGEQLRKIGFFSKFKARLEPDPQRASVTHFTVTRAVLAEAGLGPEAITRACLFMILEGAYCDAHVLTDVVPKYSSDHAA